MPHADFPTALGTCRIAWQDDRLTGFRLPGNEPDGPRPTAGDPPPPWVAAVIARVQRHLQGDLQDFADVSYAFTQVGEFAAEVYRALLAIKPGQTCSYGDLARALGHPPAASRAVGHALGANPWPLLVPCHRVVAGDGRMTGFSAPGGIRTKLRLLALEGAQLFAE
ncbi:MAG: MGMT family protein [Opitutaceae bacterium]|nr:MGMT family protein [Opitutaceae bacterium]